MVNKKNEILVINVDTENKLIDRYIKKALNYKKLKTNTTKKLFKNSGKNQCPLTSMHLIIKLLKFVNYTINHNNPRN